MKALDDFLGQVSKLRGEENPFIHALWVAPLLLIVFYYIGEGMKAVEKKHSAWVVQQNAKNAATVERKDR